MKTSHAIFAIAMTAATFTLGNTAFASSDRAYATDKSIQTENWLAIPGVYNILSSAGYRDIYDIERKKDVYQIKAVNDKGGRVKIYMDPMTGEVLDTRMKSQSYKERADRSIRQSNNAADADKSTQTENWLAIPVVYDKLSTAGYTDIQDMEREDGGYQVKVVNAYGERMKLYVDPLSGDVLDTRIKSAQ